MLSNDPNSWFNSSRLLLNGLGLFGSIDFPIEELYPASSLVTITNDLESNTVLSVSLVANFGIVWLYEKSFSVPDHTPCRSRIKRDL